MNFSREDEIRIAIVGGTGFGAGELLRLLVQHPKARVCTVVSRSKNGLAIGDVHPHLRGLYRHHSLSESLDLDAFSGHARNVIFLGLPHGESAGYLGSHLDALRERNIVVIDLSGDHRLRDPEVHARIYSHSPRAGALREGAPYGLPELFKDAIKTATVIANPGCYATTSILSVAPLAARKLLKSVSFDAKSGTSGAGRSLSERLHHPLRHASMSAYSVLDHRHAPEIVQTLESIAEAPVPVGFVPHLLPCARGIFVTAHIELTRSVADDEFRSLYEEFYRGAPFVRLVPSTPEISAVAGSNFCDIAVHPSGTRAVVCAALDNLVKGMAGQAIQNMNIVFGLEETTGLRMAGLGIV